jgi:hypothetical protein
MASLFTWLALGVGGYVLLDKARSGQSLLQSPDMAMPGAGPQPLRAGTGYLFFVRLETSDEAATAALAPKGAQNLTFGEATVPPFWTRPGESYSTRIASFKATPAGNGQVTLGDPFYGIGRLEKVVRLDGQEFSAPAAEA